MLNWWRSRSKNQKLEILIDTIAVIVAIVCLYIYYHQETVEIPLSQAVELSKGNAFSDLKFNNGILTLTVVEDKTIYTEDVSGKGISLKGEQVVISKSEKMTLTDLQDIGFVLPETYQQKASVVSPYVNIIFQVIFIVGILFILWYFMGGGVFGQSGKTFKKDKNIVSFANVGGLGEVKDSLKEIVGFIKDRSYFDKVGAEIPRGVLLVGLPGTGKTLLARALATEADVPFIYSSGAEFHSTFVAVAAMRIRALFKKAKKYPSSMVFIDEFDALAHKRGISATDLQRDESNTLNQLLSEMDGFKKDSKVMVLAATNRIEVLDPAVLRPGRFDRKINIFLPTLNERIEILKIHSEGKPFSDNVSMEDIAKQTSGFSGADLASLLNESAIITAKKHEGKITNQTIMEAIDKVMAGEERKGFVLSEKEHRIVAYHESGHAVVASFIPEVDKVQRISILPHGQAGGFTRLTTDTESALILKTKAMGSISVLLGGRVAEELVMGDISSSAQDDIKKANMVAREMVTHFGMGEKFGLRYDNFNETGVKELSNASCDIIDEEIKRILGSCYKTAKKILSSHRDVLDRIATRLLEVEVLNSEEIEKLIKG